MMKKVLAYLAVPVLTLSFYGCQNDAASLGMNPEEALNKMTANMANQEKGSFDAEIMIKVEAEDGDMDMDIGVTGKQDKSDIKNPKFEMSISASGEFAAEGEEYSGDVKADIVQIGQDIYLRLLALNVDGEMGAMVNQYVSTFKGQWYRLPTDMLPPEASQAFSASEEQVEQMLRIRAVAAKTDMFDMVEDHGVESVNGVSAVHYTVKLNREGIRSFLQAVSEDFDEVSFDESMASLDMFLDSTTHSIDLWIGVKDLNLLRAEVAVVGEVPDTGDVAGGEFDVRMKLDFMDHGKNMNIEVPAGAQDFNPLSLMMGGMVPMGGDMGGFDMSGLEGMEDFDMSGLEGLEGFDMGDLEGMDLSGLEDIDFSALEGLEDFDLQGLMNQ